MKVRRVNRYYCDFCKKAGCSSGHMKAHESWCTANPNRTCRMCTLIGEKQRPLADLKALMPMEYAQPKEFSLDWVDMHADARAAALIALREAANDCPVCILAALRQQGVMGDGFDFKAEMAEAMKTLNEAHDYEY